MALSKRYKALAAKVDRNKLYALDEALKLVKETAKAKFDESIDVAVNLGIDAKKSDQLVRGSVVLPKGTGKTMRVRYSRKVLRQKKLRLRVLISSVSTIWLKPSKQARWISTWSSPLRTRCVSLVNWVRSSAHAA